MKHLISEGCTWAEGGGPVDKPQSIQAAHVLGQVVCHVPWRGDGKTTEKNGAKTHNITLKCTKSPASSKCPS